jgi:drug/metabolite transporter (DMT)-like permease
MTATTHPRSERAQLGIAMVLGAWLFFSVVDTSVKWLILAGLPALQLAFMRYAGHLVLAVMFLGRSRVADMHISGRVLHLVVLRAVLLVAATALNFVALKFLSLTVTSAIMFSTPIVVAFLSVPILGERVGPWRWFAIGVGFVGVIIVVQPFGAAFHWAAILPLHNAFALALYSLITRKLAGEVSTEVMQLYMGIIGTVIMAPFAAVNWVNPTNVLDWMLMVGVGIFGWAGHEFMTRSHWYAPASTLMPFMYTFILYLTLASYVIFNEIPAGSTFLGAGIIILSGLVIWVREQRSAR